MVVRGIDHDRHELSTAAILRETRPVSRQVLDFFRVQENALAILLFLAFLVAVMPGFQEIGDVLWPILGVYGWLMWRRPHSLPLRLPKYLRKRDPSDRQPNTRRPQMASGIACLAAETKSGGQVWWSNTDLLTHLLVLGTTGSGKTEALLTVVTNALAMGTGAFYIDGKADNDLWKSVYSLARAFGRDDDLLLVNYLAREDKIGSVSNTLNPFASGAAPSLINLLNSLTNSEEGMWSDRALVLATSVVPGLVWLRDHDGLLLDASVIRDHFSNVSLLVKLQRHSKLPREYRDSVSGFLNTLPGWKDEAFNDDGTRAAPKDPTKPIDLSVADEQFGYVKMQWTRALNTLADMYRNVFKGLLPDIDMFDVVVNRRIVVVNLPALKVTDKELANLGRIALAAFMEMLGEMLGDVVEGNVDAAINNRPTKGPVPYIGIFDELGAYPLDEVGNIFTQGRSLGLAAVAATQEATGILDGSEKMAHKLIGSTNTKAIMNIRDPGATRDLVMGAAGKTRTAVTSGFSGSSGPVGGYYDTQEAQIQEVDRIDWQDLVGQAAGQAHMVIGTRIIRTAFLYIKPKVVPQFRIHRFLSVFQPPIGDSELGDEAPAADGDDPVARLLARAGRPDWSAAAEPGLGVATPELDLMARAFRAGMAVQLAPTACGCVAVAALGEATGRGADTLRAAVSAGARQAAPIEPAVSQRELVEPAGSPVEAAGRPFDPDDDWLIIDAEILGVPQPGPAGAVEEEDAPAIDFGGLARHADRLREAMSALMNALLGESEDYQGPVAPNPPEADRLEEATPAAPPLFGSAAADDEKRGVIAELAMKLGQAAPEAMAAAEAVLADLSPGAIYPAPPPPSRRDPRSIEAILRSFEHFDPAVAGEAGAPQSRGRGRAKKGGKA